ncbi:hypothetical protein GQ649_12910 [Rhodococcus sp. DSM 6344]|nr:hypothetical protein [Rhodococcus erythropolis]
MNLAHHAEGAVVPAFDADVNGGCYFLDSPMVPIEPHEDSPAIGLQVQGYRIGDEDGVDRGVGIVPVWPDEARQWPYFMTLRDALQFAEVVRCIAEALIQDEQRTA